MALVGEEELEEDEAEKEEEESAARRRRAGDDDDDEGKCLGDCDTRSSLRVAVRVPSICGLFAQRNPLNPRLRGMGAWMKQRQTQTRMGRARGRSSATGGAFPPL